MLPKMMLEQPVSLTLMSLNVKFTQTGSKATIKHPEGTIKRESFYILFL